MKSYAAKPTGVSRQWYVLDASAVPLGRMASAAAKLLIGKSKVEYTPHVDGGDYVIVINAQKIKVTGAKLSKKTYYRHSGYPGGLTTETLAEVMAQNPVKAVQTAVSGMLPRNKLRAARIKRLKVYAGSEHNHTAQNPKEFLLTREASS